MKKYLVASAAIVMVIAMGGGAYAGTITPAVTASATVQNICVAGGTGAISLGTWDASQVYTGSTNLTGMTLWCTKGDTAVQVAVGNGSNFASGTKNLKAATSADLIPYTITCTAGCSAAVTGKGKTTDLIADSTIAMHGNITANGLDVAPADSYSDSVTLTITY